MTLVINRKIYDELIEYAISGGDQEVCGYLSGAASEGVATHLFKMKNVSDTPKTFFWMEQKEQFGLMRELRAQGLVNLVCFHSHPTGGEDLSIDDKKILQDKNLKYIIVSLHLEKPLVKAWSFDGSEYKDEEIEIRAEEK